MIKVNRESFWTRNSFEILEINTQNCDRLFDTSRNFEMRVFFLFNHFWFSCCTRICSFMLSIESNWWFYWSTKSQKPVQWISILFFPRFIFSYSSGSDLYHTCYCLSGLSVFQNGGKDQTPIICGDDTNKLVKKKIILSMVIFVFFFIF